MKGRTITKHSKIIIFSLSLGNFQHVWGDRELPVIGCENRVPRESRYTVNLRPGARSGAVNMAATRLGTEEAVGRL